MKIFNYLLFFTFVITSIGCGTTGPKFSKVTGVNEKRTPVYVYRSKISCGAFDPIFIQVNGYEVGKLYNQGYTFALVDPGEHLVTASMTSMHAPQGGTSPQAIPDGSGGVIVVTGSLGKKVPFDKMKFAGIKKIKASKGKPTYVKYDMSCSAGILPKVQPDKDLQIVSENKALPEIEMTKLGLVGK